MLFPLFLFLLQERGYWGGLQNAFVCLFVSKQYKKLASALPIPTQSKIILYTNPLPPLIEH
jgi:hypothetical protein